MAMIEFVGKVPNKLPALERATAEHGFTMSSDRLTGSLLRALCASKAAASILELGTGTGLSACWMLDGMDEKSRLITIDNDPDVVAIAKAHLIDPRIEFRIQDGMEALASLNGQKFDIVFADALPGKYEGFEITLSLLRENGFCLLDDMLSQPNWPSNHQPSVDSLLESLATRNDLFVCRMDWSTGIVLITKASNKTVGEQLSPA